MRGLKSAASHLQERSKLLRALTDAIRGPANLSGGPWIGVHAAGPVVPLDRLYRDMPLSLDMVDSYHKVLVERVTVLGVPCQSFTYDGVLLKVLPL